MSAIFYHRSTQTEPGTGNGTYDLSPDQGSPEGSVESPGVNSADFGTSLAFTIEVGEELSTGEIEVSTVVVSFDGDVEVRLRAQRLDSAGNVQDSSTFSDVISSVGTHTRTVEILTDWNPGDRLRIQYQHRRVSGHGNARWTAGTERADGFVDAPSAITLLADDLSSGQSTGEPEFDVFEGPAPNSLSAGQSITEPEVSENFQSAHPDSDVSNDDWVNELDESENLHTSLSDSDPGTFIESTAPGARLIILLEDLLTPRSRLGHEMDLEHSKVLPPEEYDMWFHGGEWLFRADWEGNEIWRDNPTGNTILAAEVVPAGVPGWNAGTVIIGAQENFISISPDGQSTSVFDSNFPHEPFQSIRALAVDPDGYVYAMTTAPTDPSNGGLRKYDSNGNELWHLEFTPIGEDIYIVVSEPGWPIYIEASNGADLFGSNYVLRKMTNPTNTSLPQEIWSRSPFWETEGEGGRAWLAVDHEGYSAVYRSNSTPQGDYLIGLVDPDGDDVFEYRITGTNSRRPAINTKRTGFFANITADIHAIAEDESQPGEPDVLWIADHPSSQSLTIDANGYVFMGGTSGRVSKTTPNGIIVSSDLINYDGDPFTGTITRVHFEHGSLSSFPANFGIE